MTTSAVIQPVIKPTPLQPIQAPFGAVMARQLSVWPFAARTARLFVLVDTSLPDEPLRQGLLRAMQQGYFASDGYSQTRAVREAALAAHYVLQHHNRDVLPLDHVNAASAVAAVRGTVAFVALAGHARAFAWRNAELTTQQGALRLPRPLGTEHDPPITLWRTPLHVGERLVLVCGARWTEDSKRAISEILSSTSSNAAAQRQLADALGDAGPAGILVIAPTTTSLRVPHLGLVGSREDGATAKPPNLTQIHPRFSPRRWLFPSFGLLLLSLVMLATLVLAPQPQPSTLATHRDVVSPRLAVQLGASAANVVDMAVGDGAVYTLDVAEGAVRAFALDALNQQLTPDTLVAQAGISMDAFGRRLAKPVAIEYLPGPSDQRGRLAIVDQSRSVVEIGQDGSLSPLAVPSSAGWQELGALGVGATGELLFVDSGARKLLAYPRLSEPVLDAPRLLLDGTSAPRLPFERVAQVLGTTESVIVRLDDGTLHRLDPGGAVQPLPLLPADVATSDISAMAPDRAGGLYLADPLNARVVETSLDGTLRRELHAPTLAGTRAIDVSLDGHRLFALVDSGILVIDIPSA